MTAIKQIIAETKTLVSPPDVWFRFNEAVNTPSTSIQDITEIVKTDPSLVANVLKIVNSAYYGLRSRVDTVSRAITIIGMDDLYSIVTSVVAVNSFSKIATNLVKPATFWRHSFCTALLARKIARQVNVLHTERLYVAGLLHDLGSLIIYANFPDESERIISLSDGDEEKQFSIEQETLGFTHADVGAELLAEWGLPQALVNTIRYHHNPQDTDENVLDACIVHLANSLANCHILGTFLEKLPAGANQPNDIVWKYIEFTEEQKAGIYTGLDDDLAEAISILIPYKF